MLTTYQVFQNDGTDVSPTSSPNEPLEICSTYSVRYKYYGIIEPRESMYAQALL